MKELIEVNNSALKRLTLTEKTIINGLEHIVEGMELTNPELVAVTALAKSAAYPEAGIFGLDLAFNKTANKVPSAISAINWLFNQNKSLEKRVESLEGKTEKLEVQKADKTAVDERMEELLQSLDKKMESLTQSMNSRMEELEKRANEMIAGAKKRMGEVEVATLWRIQDCEEALRSKASEKFVQDSIQTINESLREEVTSFQISFGSF